MPGAALTATTSAGRHAAAGRMVQVQRARIVAAMIQAVAERGVASTTVTHVVAGAGVSRRTFYEIFADREECFLAAMDTVVERLRMAVLPVYEGRGSWLERVRGAVIATLELFDRKQDFARLLIVESLAAGPVVFERRQELIARLVGVVDEGRDRPSRRRNGDGGPPPLTAEGVVGGLVSVVHARLLAPSPQRLVELAPALTGMIVLPYLGTDAARREHARKPPRGEREEASVEGSPESALRDPLRDLGMRLTYRTMMVLLAIAEHPGLSNRVLAEDAGISDQGQISKLLGRLERLGLVQNDGVGAARGGSNAWTLTPRGENVLATTGHT